MKLKTREQAEAASGEAAGSSASRDELYEQAIEIVVREGRGSVSLLQRALGIGYGRAARLIDFMAEDGIVGALQRQQRPRGAAHAGGVGVAEEGGGMMDGEIVSGASGRQVATSPSKPVRSA